jgi:photosystem II Psb27 protein
MLLKKTFELFFKDLTKAISFALSLIVVFTLFNAPSYAATTSMTGNYTEDTLSVVKTLQIAVDTPKDSPNKDEVKDEALILITDYISRYRNRGMVNKTQSFTTMQTALNAMAGHYKNFASRPLPDKLKERLTKEFSLAEKMVLRES